MYDVSPSDKLAIAKREIDVISNNLKNIIFNKNPTKLLKIYLKYMNEHYNPTLCKKKNIICLLDKAAQKIKDLEKCKMYDEF